MAAEFRRVLTVLGAVWWAPILAICALLLGRAGVSGRVRCLVIGHDWYVLSNGGFCRLRLAPRGR